VSGELHIQLLYPRRDYPAPIGQRAGGDADQVWKLRSKDKSLPQLGIKLLS